MLKFAIMNRITALRKELNAINDAIAAGESDAIIYDSFEEYNKSMLDYIKLKLSTRNGSVWIEMLVDMIEEQLQIRGTNETAIRNILSENKDMNKHFINRIVDILFNDDAAIEEESDIEQNDLDEDIDDAHLNNIEDAVNNFEWRQNQLEAIACTREQDFSSGIVMHIMGAGKTYIAYKIIDGHFDKYPGTKLYLIVCNRQEVLRAMLFDEDGDIDEDKKIILKERNVIDLDKYWIVNKTKVENKKSKKIRLSKTRPTLAFVNTDFLKLMDKKGTLACSKIGLVIFDECHGVSAPQLYQILKKIKFEYKKPIIGFSATPVRAKAEENVVTIFSKETNISKTKKLNIISSYDFITAIVDNVILPPYYVLSEVNKTIGGRIGKENKNIMKNVLEKVLADAPYKKVIGWCRTVEQMKIYYKFMKENFPQLKPYCSSFQDAKLARQHYNTNWNEFVTNDGNCIMLCVNRFREGSDVKNLDVVVYLDIVQNRSLLVGLQTSGRVLRIDVMKKKTHGVIVDSFVNVDGIQVEILTADRLIKYFQHVLSLCDGDAYIEQKEAYVKMLELCSKMTFDEQKQEITIKLDDKEEHNMKVKLELKTLAYDFNKIKMKTSELIDEIVRKNEHKLETFNRIIGTLKQMKVFDINCKDFWRAYKDIPQEVKQFNMLPDDLYDEFRELFDKTTWYDLLGIDTSMWYATKNKCCEALAKLCKDKITAKKYYELCKKDKQLPVNPNELYKKENFTKIENEFNKQSVDNLFM